jgi:hypothetical protein
MAGADPRRVIARLDPAHGSAPLFVPMKRGKPRPTLHVQYRIGGCVLEWSAREALDIHDESVLLALIALAGVRGLFRDLPAELREQMQINGDLDDGEPAMVFSTWYELARWAGIRNRSSKTKRQVSESVRRLSEVILWVRLPLGRVYRMQLVAHLEMDDEGLAIALNSRLVRALCPKAHYAPVDLTERNLLGSDTARACTRNCPPRFTRATTFRTTLSCSSGWSTATTLQGRWAACARSGCAKPFRASPPRAGTSRGTSKGEWSQSQGSADDIVLSVSVHRAINEKQSCFQ